MIKRRLACAIACLAILAACSRPPVVPVAIDDRAGRIEFRNKQGKTIVTRTFRPEDRELLEERGWYERAFLNAGLVAEVYRIQGHPQSEGETTGRRVYGPDGKLLGTERRYGTGMAVAVSAPESRLCVLAGTNLGILGVAWDGHYDVLDFTGAILTNGLLDLGGPLEKLPGHAVAWLGDPDGRYAVLLRGARFWALDFRTLAAAYGTVGAQLESEMYEGAAITNGNLEVSYSLRGDGKARRTGVALSNVVK